MEKTNFIKRLPIKSKPNIVKMQEEILSYWKENRVFEKSVEEKTSGEVVFYDGPPFPTGKPHHGTVLVSFIKDMIARYWTMQGYSVPRIWGWDCHGLPIENQAEVALGIEDKSIIEKELGIDRFNEKCYEIVSNNNDSWKEYVEEMARWVDYEGAYKTMDIDYMESVMWAFKQCYEKGLIYRDYRVTPYCYHCETSLSLSDTRESDSTRPRQDRWVMVRFKSDIVYDNKSVDFVAWTTTPWTLPSNMALAVGADIDYAYVLVGKLIFIICENTISKFENVFGKEPVILKRCKGNKLVGTTYQPLFDYFEKERVNGAFKVIEAEFVGSDEGTGIVHIAPAFGEDDYWTCKRNNIPLVNPVDSKGRFTEEVYDFYLSDNQPNVIEQNSNIIRFLFSKEQALAEGTIEHNYPHCWRCKHPLIYKAMDAWYFSIDSMKEKLIEKNKEINWVPETVRDGRFGKWLENARDWNISRNRYWSTPIPIWECECCNERKVIGSREEIQKVSGIKLDDLHRQYMDEVTFQCDCGGKMIRIPEVLDCWFESAAVPFAQKHYPFENKEWFESHFPSDFIVEYTGQIRCWFYYLHVLAVALFDKTAYKNCIVHGTILAKDGKKLSKSSKNYTDPMELMKTYGTDAFRLYLYQSKAMLIGDLQFDENGLQNAIQQILLPLWNVCYFYDSYAAIDGYELNTVNLPNSDNQLDQWILAKLYETEKEITMNMNNYQINHYVDSLNFLIDGLTNWYIRRSRRRFWGTDLAEDKKNAYDTLGYVLINTLKLFAPVAPIMSEDLYTSLTQEESIHLSDWPNIPEIYCDPLLLEKVKVVTNVIYLARSLRSKVQVKNRQPLNALKIALSNRKYKEIIVEFADVISEEINVKMVEVVENIDEIAVVKFLPNFNQIRAKYSDRIPIIIKAIKSGNYELSDDNKIVWLTINGEKKQFDRDIILLDYIAKEGSDVVSEKGIVVSLDLDITEELKREGLARDIVRNIQDARKQAGYEMTDRILINVIGNVPEEWINYICTETLSQIAEFEDFAVTCEIQSYDNSTITIGIKKK